MNHNECALILFCKHPDRSKRRLLPELGAGTTAALAALLLDCALEDLRQWPGPRILSPADDEDYDWAHGLAVPDARVCVQASGNLGERLNDVDGRLRREGLANLLFVGIDAPLLDLDALRRAAEDLGTADVALGAADDGGVVYMGSRQPWPPLADLPWSTNELGRSLRSACAAEGLSVRQRGVWSDVDRAGDLASVQRELADDRRPARRRLYRWLASTAGAVRADEAG